MLAAKVVFKSRCPPTRNKARGTAAAACRAVNTDDGK